MGMSTHVVGFSPPDDEWKKKKVVWDSCVAAGVQIPEDVLKFFDYKEPDDAGREVAIEARRWSGGESEGYEVVLADLPPGVKVIRFFNAW